MVLFLVDFLLEEFDMDTLSLRRGLAVKISTKSPRITSDPYSGVLKTLVLLIILLNCLNRRIWNTRYTRYTWLFLGWNSSNEISANTKELSTKNEKMESLKSSEMYSKVFGVQRRLLHLVSI